MSSQFSEAIACRGVGTEDQVQVTLDKKIVQVDSPDTYMIVSPADSKLTHIMCVFVVGYLFEILKVPKKPRVKIKSSKTIERGKFTNVLYVLRKKSKRPSVRELNRIAVVSFIISLRLKNLQDILYWLNTIKKDSLTPNDRRI